MTVVTRSPGAVGSGQWTDFTVANLAVGGAVFACAYLDSSVIGSEGFVQSASAFGFAIPADATITSLTVEGQYRTSGEGSIALTPSQGMAATDGGNVPDWTVTQGVTDAAYPLPTVAQLNSSGFAVAAHATRPMGEVSWVYLDYITLTVEYDEYVPPEATVPTVVTAAVTDIMPNQASSGGTVTAENGSPVTERGILWGGGDVTLETADGVAVSAGGPGGYPCVAFPLLEGKGYMLRAFATNASGTGYGTAIYFETPRGTATVETQAVVAITGYWASAQCFVTSFGWSPVTERGILWGGGGATLETADGVVSNSGGSGYYTNVAAPLTPGRGYMLYAFARNSYGVAYGNGIYFETLAAPTVVTTAVTAITPTGATGGGNVTSWGGASVTDRGICWGTSPNPRTPQVSSASGGTGVYTQGLTDLEPGTRYFVAAWATNTIGAPATAYGADVTFVTHDFPVVATAGVYDIDATTATGGGNVASDGGEAVTARGVCWSIAENPTTAANIIPAMTGATTPSGVASESGHLTTFAAWMAFDHINPAGGVGYGSWVAPVGTTGYIGYQFPAAHVITRYAVTSRNEGGGLARVPKTWTFKGSNDGSAWTTLDTQTNITDWAAGANVRKVFSFANATAYAYYRLDITASNDATYVGVGELEMMEAADDTFDGGGIGAFVSHLAGLTEGVTYNVRAYAVNAAGTAYGAAVVFTATENAPPAEPPPGPPRDPSQNILFDGTLELMVGTLDVAGSATQMRYSNSNPGGFGNLSFRLPADAPYAAFDAQVVKGAAVTMKHGLVGFAATLFEGEVTSDVSHATIAGGKAYYDVTCAGLWWAAGQRKDFSMVIGDDAYDQWFTMDDNAKAFQVSTDGCLEIRLAAGQSAAAGDSASLYYWLGKGMGDPAASIDFLFGLLGLNVVGANWTAQVWSAPTPWGTWTQCNGWTNGGAADLALCIPTLGDNPQALRLQLSTTSAVDAIAEDRFVSLDKVSVGSGVSANDLSAVGAANPTVVTSTSAHGLRSGDRVFIIAASTPTISGWRTVTVTDGTHFTVPVAVTTAGGAGTFYKATRIDQALVEIAVTTGLATLASLQPGGIGNLNWGLNVRPHASRAGSIDLLAATNVAPFDYGFWDNKTFYCQDRPLAIRALHDYLIDSSLPGIDFDVRRATEDSPTVVKVLYKFRAEDGETSPYPDGTALAVYRDIDPATGLGRTFTGDWSDASVVLDVWNEWADLSLTTAQAGDLGDQILAWLSANAYQGGGSIAPATVPLRGGGDVTTYTDNIIPTMTSATAPSGVASASSDQGGAYPAWRAFDHSNAALANAWFTDFNPYPALLRYQLPSAKTVTQYAITTSVSAGYSPKSWSFQGSNNGTDWTTLDTQADVTDWYGQTNITKTFTLANTTPYPYYQFYCSAGEGGYLSVGELEMMETATTANYSAPVAYIRAGDYIEDSNLDTGPLMITGFSMDADRGVATIGIGENRRAFVERLTPDKA